MGANALVLSLFFLCYSALTLTSPNTHSTTIIVIEISMGTCIDDKIQMQMQ
jgi:hypothetical protein